MTIFLSTSLPVFGTNVSPALTMRAASQPPPSSIWKETKESKLLITHLKKPKTRKMRSIVYEETKTR